MATQPTLAQLETLSDELLARLEGAIGQDNSESELTTIVAAHQQVLSRMVELEPDRECLERRLRRLQQLIEAGTQVQNDLESKLNAIAQTRRLAKTYGKNR